ncbi:hypothetical protein [Thiocystis violacea]|uniref:hypothetical protein n=1 Tax=Thiocystis violacea TaxID=13725 RepID=UPI001903731B|nr:hypothetical protein [Thiocystis violacea]
MEETPSGEQSDAPSMTDRLSRHGPDIHAEVARDYKIFFPAKTKKRLANFSANRLFLLVGARGFEPPTT